MSGERSRRTLGMCGRVGPGDTARIDAMSELLGGVRSLVDEPSGALRADAGASKWKSGSAGSRPASPEASGSAGSRPASPEASGSAGSRPASPEASGSAETAVSWSPTPLPDALGDDAVEIAERHDAFSLVLDGSVARVYSGVSGAVPIYVDTEAAAGDGLAFCSRIEPLVATRDRSARADWDAWAHILAAGGPLEGRTTFDGVHRLQPCGRITFAPGRAPAVAVDGWPWLEVSSSAGAPLDTVREALGEAVDRLSEQTGLVSLLSGGWDSRILATLAVHAAKKPAGEPVAWTTSSDTGTVLEELVAAKVAGHLGIRHEVVPPRRDQFAADLEHFARAADYQTSFHVWLVPLARALVGTTGTVLDGLGGGLFVGGAFPDDGTDRPVLDKRFDRLARYLRGAEEILHPRVVAQIRDRTRASFEKVARPLADHPFGSTFTAYLTRTLPGISLAPYGLVAASAPVATPFLDNEVVRAALAIPPELHAGGRLYPELLRPLDDELAGLVTAQELTPHQRRHPRRVASPEAAQVLRELLTREPVRQLLAPDLATAELGVWRGHLDRTGPQHLIRSLAMLSLWLDRYSDLLDGAGVDELVGRG